MENYSKGKNVEEEWIKENIPLPNLPKDFLWMQVKPSSKMNNLLTFALKEFKDRKDIVWSGTGPAISKTISCAEITKRENAGLYQISKICSRKFEEHWEPKINGLAPLIVQRDVPAIHILLSREPLNKEEPGYQDSELNGLFWKSSCSSHKKRPNRPKPNDDQYLSMGLHIGKHKYLGKNKSSRAPKPPPSKNPPGDN
ncbi:unnamed protein product [Bemisia tabaci]|uniref:DNA/RNA-binding protein Alba-like domain-containing protein n=1 Tax=Bemisia tabaci TaxID=7038 RepID=A0A9P0AA13_BEMTA|nr:unnamed protein product [Bemisia tabaci]